MTKKLSIFNAYKVFLFNLLSNFRKIHNENSSNGKKILVLKDSFGRVVTPYLALGVDETSVIDLRHFTGSLKSYIEEYKPDAVIMLYYPGNLGESSLWIYR